jgi:glycosyltransferase involved in cell wall biosynthesis
MQVLMKICFASPSAGTIQGGGESTVRQFAKHLSKEHEVTVLTGRTRHLKMQKELENVPYEILTVPFWPRFTTGNNMACKLSRRITPYKMESFSFYYNILLRSKIKRRLAKMDIISTHYWMDSRLISNLAYDLGVPSVFHILGGPYSRDFIDADRSTMYIAVSRGTLEDVNRMHNLSISDVVTPGIPSKIFNETGMNEKVRDSNKLVFVGRLQPTKGVYELIEIFKKLVEKRPHISLTIVGDGDIKGKLMNLVKRYQLTDKITFTGSLSYNEVFEHYRKSGIFVFPSKKEVFPLVSIEAMACGLPAVVSDIPSLRESTGKNAILVPPEDIDMWVEKLDILLDDEAQKRSLSEKGREWARQFTWERMSANYAKGLHKARTLFLDGQKN